MEICKELNDLVKLLNDEKEQSTNQGFSTVTLTHDEVVRITQVLSDANQKITKPQHQSA